MTFATFYAIANEGKQDVFWRVRAPAKALGARTALIPRENAEAVITQPNSGDLLPWSIKIEHETGTSLIRSELGWKRFNKERRRYRSLKAEFPLHEGTAVFTRPSLPVAVLGKSMREQGIRTVAESDDNMFARRFNIALREEGSDEESDFHAKAMASMSACVFSTAALRDAYYREFRDRFGKGLIPELHVARNCIDVADWPERAESDGPLRVGFMGSDSHVWDINVLYGAFCVAKELGCQTHFIGYTPVLPLDDERLTEKAKRNIEMWDQVVDKSTPWVASDEFRSKGMPLDILLCPLRTDEFTLGKSDVKAIEGTISGAAVVCSNNPVFNRDWKHGENCLLATTAEDYARAVKELVENPRLRYELVTAAQEYVEKERGVETLRREWLEVVA